MDLQDRLLRQAAETLYVEISEEALKEAVENQMRTLQAQLAQQCLSMEMYSSFMNTTDEKLREDARPDALAVLRMQAAADRIAELEKLEATQEEIGQAVALICRRNNMTVEQLKPYYDAEFEAAVVRNILMTKAMKLVRDAADVTELE